MRALASITAVIAALLSAACSTTPAGATAGKTERYFVTIAFTAQKDGRITDVEVLRSDAPQEIQTAAVKAAEKWRASPGPVARGKRTIVFELNPRGTPDKATVSGPQ